MKQVVAQEWKAQKAEAHHPVARFSLHLKEADRQAFARDYREDLDGGAEPLLEPDGRRFVVQVDEAVYEDVADADNGLWYDGVVQWDGREVDLGGRSIDL